MVAGPNDDWISLFFTLGFWSNQEVRSSTCPASAHVRRPPPPQPQIMVGACPAPRAVLIFVLYGSFWKVVVVIFESGLASLNRSTACCRMPSWGAPLRNQYDAPPLPPPGPDVPQAESAIESGTPAARPRKVRREVGVATLVLRSRAADGGGRFRNVSKTVLRKPNFGFGFVSRSTCQYCP